MSYKNLNYRTFKSVLYVIWGPFEQIFGNLCNRTLKTKHQIKENNKRKILFFQYFWTWKKVCVREKGVRTPFVYIPD